MREKSAYRSILMVAGFLAVATIILSHAISREEIKKTGTEQSAEKSDQKTVISVPAEAVTQGTAVQIDEQVPNSLLETISAPSSTPRFVPSSEKIVSKFFRVLFKNVIAPNAP